MFKQLLCVSRFGITTEYITTLEYLKNTQWYDLGVLYNGVIVLYKRPTTTS